MVNKSFNINVLTKEEIQKKKHLIPETEVSGKDGGTFTTWTRSINERDIESKDYTFYPNNTPNLLNYKRFVNFVVERVSSTSYLHSIILPSNVKRTT